MVGKHLIKGWAKTLALIALSSAESELYAALKTAAEALGLMSMGKDMGYKLGGQTWRCQRCIRNNTTTRPWTHAAYRYKLPMGAAGGGRETTTVLEGPR